MTPIVFLFIPCFGGMTTLRKSSKRLGSCVLTLGTFMFMFDCPQNVVLECWRKVNRRLTKTNKRLAVPHNVVKLVKGKCLCIF